MWTHATLAVLLALAGAAFGANDCTPGPCTFEYNPICGSDGVTYGNPCMFRNANCKNDLSIDHYGECTTPAPRKTECRMRPCTFEYNPICGSDGVTYANPCMFNASNCNNDLSINHWGECTTPAPTQSECPLVICTDEYNPVCGTDGVTYANPCEFEAAVKCRGNLEQDHMGKCEEGDESDCRMTVCTEEYEPVCATNGVTYGNKCMYDAANCHGDLDILFNGECLQIDPTPSPCPLIMCTADYTPVCGTDGRTYGNACVLQSANCNNGVTMDHDGECDAEESDENGCPAKACTMEYEPVCATNGVTYGNKCAYDVANCNGDLDILFNGECLQIDPTPSPCPAILCNAVYSPVCGTDGVTYGNECMLKSESCNNGATMAHAGECTKEAPTACTPRPCTMEYMPVCGSDGVTYGNRCAFNSANCRGDLSYTEGEC